MSPIEPMPQTDGKKLRCKKAETSGDCGSKPVVVVRLDASANSLPAQAIGQISPPAAPESR